MGPSRDIVCEDDYHYLDHFPLLATSVVSQHDRIRESGGSPYDSIGSRRACRVVRCGARTLQDPRFVIQMLVSDIELDRDGRPDAVAQRLGLHVAVDHDEKPRKAGWC